MNKTIDLQSNNLHLSFQETKDISVYAGDEIKVIVYGYPYDRNSANWLQACDIAKNYEINGTRFLNQIDGSFSIVILGMSDLVITDAFGIYNLYLTKRDNKFHVSNKLKNMITSLENRDIDEVALNDFLLLGYMLGNKTLFKKIKKLEPGTIYKFNKDFSITKYHQIDLKPTNEAELIECFDKHISIGTNLSNKIVLPLTAGLDSRVILSGIVNDNIDIFTHQTNNTKDIKQAKAICSSLNLSHHVHLWKDIFSVDFLSITLEQFECMINPYLFIPLYGSHRLAQDYGNTIWNGNGGEIYRNYYGRFGDKQFKVENFYDRIWIIRQIEISDYHKQMLIESIQKELNKYRNFEYDTALNMFYLYNRYANFTGYSLMMSGKMLNIFQPFISKKLINKIFGVNSNLLNNGKLLKSIIEKNYYSLTNYNVNGKEFFNPQAGKLTAKVLIRKIQNKYFYSNNYSKMISSFNNDFEALFTDLHPALEKYKKTLVDIKTKRKDYYYITNLMAVNKYLKMVIK